MREGLNTAQVTTEAGRNWPIQRQASYSTPQSDPQVFMGRTYEHRPLIRRETNQDLAEKERLEQQRRDFERRQNQPVISQLGAHIRSSFTMAVSSKSTVMDRMMRCLRRRQGIYEADVAELIAQQGGTNIYMMLTDVKCCALESWLKDVMIPPGQRPYKIEPTPVPDIPPEYTERATRAFWSDYLSRVAEQAGLWPEQITPQMLNEDDVRQAIEKFRDELLKQIRAQAKTDADQIEEQVDDELVEGKWYEALNEFIEDFATYPTAFLEGPLYRRRQVLQWQPVMGTGLRVVQVVEKIVKEYERLDPYDVYPAPGARSIQDGDLCVRKRFTRRDLDALRGVEGYDKDAIDQVLKEYASGYREFVAYDTEIADLHGRPQEWTDPEGHIDGIKFFGSVQGFKLREWGMSIEQIPDPFREYPIIAYLVGSYVIGARLNPHPLGRRTIYSASFRHKNGSIWGRALPETMADCQDVCNSAARAMCNNAAMSSGPQVWQYVDMIPQENRRTEMFPWKIWEFSSERIRGQGMKPMDFFQPTLIVNELLSLYKHFFDQASEVTGVPAYVYGNDKIGGAGSTASGLSMLMNAAAKGLRNAASQIDRGIICPSVEEHWLVVMLTRPDLARGDCRIKARASDYLIQQEQLQMRRMEFIDRVQSSPAALQIVGIDGLSELYREAAKTLKMDPEKIVPRREDMIQTMVQQAVQETVVKLAQALGLDPGALMQALQGGPAQGAGPAKQPQALDAAGNPVSGQDVNVVQ